MNMLKKNLQRAFASILAVLVIAACAPAKKKEAVRVLFPPPPDEPRFEWIATITTPEDIPGEAQSQFNKLLLGETADFSFSGPISAVALSNGNVVVSDIYDRNLKLINLNEKEIGIFSESTFKMNLGLAVDAKDQVYVAEGDSRRILIFSARGEPVGNIGGPEFFSKPAMLAINERLNRIYATDPVDSAIKVFSLDGEFLFEFGQRGIEDGEFNAPQGLAIDQDGNLYVADMLNARVQKFSPDGEFLDKFGERGQFSQHLENPKGLAFDTENHLYVADSRRPNFRVFEPDGTLLIEVGSAVRSDHKLGFGVPVSIFVDQQDKVYVADFLNRRIAVWQYLSAAYKSRVAVKSPKPQ